MSHRLQDPVLFPDHKDIAAEPSGHPADSNLFEGMYRDGDSHPSSLDFRFLELPTELQLLILKKLDGASIFACRQASRALASIIDDDLHTTYLLELGLAGMVDGPSDSEDFHPQRLHALRAFRAAWASGEHPVHEITLDSLHNFAGDMADLDQQEGRLRIRRPPGTFCGLSAKEYIYEGLAASDVNLTSIMGGFHVDLAQDLFVCCSSGPHASLQFCSLEKGFSPHPLATQFTITSCFTEYVECYVNVQILGDIVLWCIHEDDTDEEKDEFLVINWKTGVIVWHMHSMDNRLCAILLSQRHLCVLHRDNLTVHLYTINPDTPSNSPLSFLDDSPVVLYLPACSDRVVKKSMDGTVRPRPTYPQGTPYHFAHDPNLSLVMFTIHLEYNPSSVGHVPDEQYGSDDDYHGHYYPRLRTERFMLFVPIDTLIRSYSPAGLGALNTAAPINDPNLPANRIHLSWERWGPHGTRMIFAKDVAHGISVNPMLGPYAALPRYVSSDATERHSLFARRERDTSSTRSGNRTTTRTLPRLHEDDDELELLDQRYIFLTQDGLARVKIRF
ncbi:hypothetical protein C8Q70DRAFT_937266 [Cubamyces menziesii]|nr:hypothetical protein C8Q70DRAFT_937266 [Cubamyces menziesii]